VLALAVVAAAGVTGLAACDSQGSGQALAQQACVHVHQSARDWLRSATPGTPAATVARLQKDAAQELRLALPLAAAANSDDGTWNALMTDLSESAITDEGHLLPSLQAQCAVADSNPNVNPQNPQNPQTPSNPPNTQNVNPRGASG
jgi:hypothetical protein